MSKSYHAAFFIIELLVVLGCSMLLIPLFLTFLQNSMMKVSQLATKSIHDQHQQSYLAILRNDLRCAPEYMHCWLNISNNHIMWHMPHDTTKAISWQLTAGKLVRKEGVFINGCWSHTSTAHFSCKDYEPVFVVDYSSDQVARVSCVIKGVDVIGVRPSGKWVMT